MLPILISVHIILCCYKSKLFLKCYKVRYMYVEMEMYFFSLLYIQVKVIQDKGVLQQKEI